MARRQTKKWFKVDNDDGVPVDFNPDIDIDGPKLMRLFTAIEDAGVARGEVEGLIRLATLPPLRRLADNVKRIVDLLTKGEDHVECLSRKEHDLIVTLVQTPIPHDSVRVVLGLLNLRERQIVAKALRASIRVSRKTKTAPVRISGNEITFSLALKGDNKQ